MEKSKQKCSARQPQHQTFVNISAKNSKSCTESSCTRIILFFIWIVTSLMKGQLNRIREIYWNKYQKRQKETKQEKEDTQTSKGEEDKSTDSKTKPYHPKIYITWWKVKYYYNSRESSNDNLKQGIWRNLWKSHITIKLSFYIIYWRVTNEQEHTL